MSLIAARMTELKFEVEWFVYKSNRNCQFRWPSVKLKLLKLSLINLEIQF